MINKLNELDLDIKRCEIVLKENNYLDIVIAIEEIHDKYKNTIDSISNISRDVVWNYSKKDIENIQNYLKDYKDELILKEKQKNIYDKFIDLKEYIEDKDILEKCYQTFYHPSNMMLFVVGNIQVEDTIQLIRNNQAKKHFDKEKQIQREITKEPQGIDKKEDILHMDVIMPKVIVSMKINDILSEPKEKLKRELGMNILLDLLFSKSSPLFEEWTRLGIINDSFSANFTQERDYSFLQIGGDTMEPEKLRDKILDLIHSIKDYAIDDVEFQRVQKKNIGVLIGVFNSPEGIANLFSRYYFEGIMIFDLIDCVATLKKEDIENLKALFDIDLTSTCMVKAK